jgi:hypothetical protein
MIPIQWQEPVSFRNAINRLYYPRKLNFLPLFSIAFGLTALLILIPIIKGRPVNGSWPLSLLIAFAVGFAWFATVLLIMAISYLSSRIIAITPQGFFIKEWHGKAIGFATWGWGNISFCTIERMELDGHPYIALIAHLSDNRKLYLGLEDLNRPRNVPLDQIESAIQQYGKEVRRYA